ncbi:MAG: hypothetical protein WD894_26315 [Pirellulales bacterium]
MHRIRKYRTRKLGFESLEGRRLMAGDVQVFVYPTTGELNLVGDSSANAVDVRGTGNPGEVLITPLTDQATGQQTTIDGSAAPLVMSGVTGGLAANMFAGNDEFYLKDFAFGGGGWITGNAGADTIRVGAWVAYGTEGTGDVSFAGKLRVSEQSDNSIADHDNIFVGRVTAERVEVSGRFGNDYVELYDVTATGATDGYPTLYLLGEDGSDSFNIAYTTAYGNAKIIMDTVQTGHDLVSMITSVIHGTAYIDVWHGTNTIALNANQFLMTLDIWSEIGDDTIKLTNSFFNKKVSIASFHTNNGNDAITVENNTISERLYVSSGSGNDTIVVQANQIVTAAIYSGAGYDGVIVRSNIFYGHIDMVAGTEYDVLFLSGNLFYSTYAYYEFESIQP